MHVTKLFALLFFGLVALSCAMPLHPHPKLSKTNLMMSKVASKEDNVSVTGLETHFGPPGQWVFVYGSGFVPDQTTVTFWPARGSKAPPAQTLKGSVYNSDILGVTVPSDCPPFANIGVSTPSDTARGTDVFTLGVPVLPPAVYGFSSDSGKAGCYLYISGDNFFVGKTRIFFGDVEVDPVVYDSSSIGLSVPSVLQCLAGSSVKARIETPNGKVTATHQFVILDGSSSDFC